MAEIVDDEGAKLLNGDGIDGKKEKKKVEILVRTIGPTRPSRLSLHSPIKVQDLRNLIAQSNQSPIGNLRIILQGNVLRDSENGKDAYVQLNDGDSLTVAVKPKPPNKNLRAELDADSDSDDDDLKFQLPQSSSRWQRKLYLFLHEKLKLPDIVMMAIFSLRPKVWIMIILWFILAPVAHKFSLGPIYIIGTGFVLILLNLGKRKPGEASAYSIFNEDFRELPGTLNADRLDRDLRAGHF